MPNARLSSALGIVLRTLKETIMSLHDTLHLAETLLQGS